MRNLPVAVIGAGPVGLAAASELAVRGERLVVLEAGASVGAAVTEWGHVRLFSPWRYCIGPAGRGLLAGTGWIEPDPDALPAGEELVTSYLQPLAEVEALRGHIRLDSRVTAVARLGFDKVRSGGREKAPFELTVITAEGEERLLARAVIDVSGTWRTANPLGAAGVPAVGEAAASAQITRRLPDILGRSRERHLGRRTLVVGSGHSAFNAILDLVDLKRVAPTTEISWAIRRGDPGQIFGGGEADALPARGALGSKVFSVVQSGQVRLVTGFTTTAVVSGRDGLRVSSGKTVLGPFDEVIAATGFRPDLALTAELRLDLDPIVEAPRALAPLIDPNLHSCGTVPPHGVFELSHPEAGYYTAGMKSYGRAPTFLMLTGYEQVRSIVAELCGDHEAARRVELKLPESGVCSAQPAFIRLSGSPLNMTQPASVGCCGGPAPVGSGACCVADEEAKANGESGCGCG